MRIDTLLRPGDVVRVGSNHDDARSQFFTVDAASVDFQARLRACPSLQAKSTGKTSGVLLDCRKCATTNMLCDECISCLWPATGLAEDHFSAFQFCLQHFVRVHAREFPFLHSSSWRTSWELSGKALAMAAIGGCRIPSYGGHSRLYFDLAVNQVKSFTASLDGAEYQDPPGTATWNDACYRRLLTSFETYILLIRYSVWSEFADLREWGIKTLADHAITVMPRLARVMSDNSHNSTSWLLWLLLEESKRRNDSNAPQHLIGLTVPSQIAFYYLMSQEPMLQLTPNKVGTYTSHILLCNLLNTYETGRTSSWNFASLDAYLDSDISCFRLRTELIRALDYWKWLFWRDPHELWHSRHPDHQINSMMLCVYLEAQMWSSSKPHLLSASRRRAGAQLAFDLLSLISRTGLLEVGAKSPFYVEPVVYFCTRSLGQAMLAWYDSLGDGERTGGRATDDADWMLYDKILECLNRLPGTLDGFSLPRVHDGPSSPTPPSPLSLTNSLRDAIVRVWSLVTGDDKLANENF
ncbi:hypothetical protein AnigIFM63309_005782 [Aspergillus niger]|nr:hypothetical protein AnigIFM63309_005782 [Aspergillus niger]